MIADARQREEALDPGRSFIVQAPAGSGKTGLLVQRFLTLLSTVTRPESIVAITFTRKAAGEMRERILDALIHPETRDNDDKHAVRTAELARAVLAQDRLHGWDLLRDPSRLQLQTIDSLCAMLARQMPLVSGFVGSIQVVEDATELYREAATTTLRRLAEGETHVRELLARLGLFFDSEFNSLIEQIVGMLARRDQWQFDHEKMTDDSTVADFSMLLSVAENVLADIFREHRRVDFPAITDAAIRVLGSPDQASDFLYGLDYRIQHLLVDEFQDTSLSQYKLIDALTAQWSAGDGHSLFLVGDPMQSIYRFRGADVGLFQKTWNDARLHSVQLHRLSLDTNFRSTPAILSWIDTQFAAISEGGEYEVPFRAVTAARDEEGPPPEWRAFAGDDGSEQALAVTGLARESLATGSVAILVRNRNHLLEILPALRAAGLLYEAVEIDLLGARQYILDLLSLMRALLHLADRVAWLACLRAPWCALSLADLTALVAGDRDRPIYDLLHDGDRLATLSPEGRAAAIHTGEILSAAVAQAGRMPLRTLVEQTWLLLGGPTLLRGASESADVLALLSLIESLERGGVIEDFSELNARLALLYAAPTTDPKAVQIMTVFKAKGLEFDTVILPRLEGISQMSDRDLLVLEEGMVAAQPQRGEKNEDYEVVQKIRAEKDKEELKRLLYVAATRARNRLYLVGSSRIKQKERSLETPRSGSFLRLLWNGAMPEFQTALARSTSQLGFDFAAPKHKLRKLPASWHLPRFSPWVTWQPPFVEATPSAGKVVYEWVSDTGRHVGTVLHELLKHAAGSGAAPPENQTLVVAELQRLGVAESELESAAARVRSALRNTLASERGSLLLRPRAGAQSEWTVSGVVANQLVNGTIDRVFRDEDGRLWIVDFKTGDHKGANIKKFLDAEQRRYRSQLESYAALVSRLMPGPIWLALYFPLLDAWREWQYEESGALTTS